MAKSQDLEAIRRKIRAATLEDEQALGEKLVTLADVGADVSARAQASARAFVVSARAGASRSSLIDKFLQEYGLSTSEGVTLMRLAEALLRTPDAATADALIKDKVEAGDWADHKGKSPFPLVNFSTRALMLTASWLDDIEAKDPARRLVKSTKSILDRVGDPVIRAAVGQAMKIMGEHFVLGETIDEAMRRAKEYARKGYTFSFDMLGEAAITAADADKFFADYKNAIAAIARHAKASAPHDNPGISVKLSALHPRYEYAQKARVLTELGSRVFVLAKMARDANIGFNIDAEECDRLDLSLDIIDSLMRHPELEGWEGFGVVVQAYQRRARHVLEWLAAMARATNRRIMVRLVKGAYWDAEIKRAQVMGLASYPVFTRKVLTDVSYVACARFLIDNADVIYPQFATHNALTATMVQEMASALEPGKGYELQRLHGMGEALHDSLLEAGLRSRIYAPVGGHKELLPYLVRRLLENGANSSFVNQLIDPDLSVDDVIVDPVAEARALDRLPNPAIPAPRDLFDGERLSAEGWDDTDPATLEKITGALARNIDFRGAASGIASVNPVSGEHIATCAVTSGAELDEVIRKAKDAQPKWAERTDRSDILMRAALLLEAEALDFFGLASQEAGKTVPDCIAEVREAVDFLRYYALQSKEATGPSLGVVATISPWNFPLAIFLGQVSAALAVGNAVIAKPAEQTPLIALKATDLLHRAGVPKEVLVCVIGDGPSVGAPLTAHEDVSGVVFTGSTAVAQTINKVLAARATGEPVLIAETGGINAMIVDSTALMESAVKDVVASAFKSAGQRCSACRVVCVQADVADKFEEMLSGAMAELQVGDPARPSTDVGPIIDSDAQTEILAYIEEKRESAHVIAQTPAPTDGGFYVPPTALRVDHIRNVTREIFGPVLHVVHFDGARLHRLVEDINDLGYGLTLGVHTRIDETMEEIAARARVGNIYVNRNQIGAVVGVQPFGGEALSGTGPKAGGPHYLDALVKPPAADGESFVLDDAAPTVLFDQIFDSAKRAQQDWSLVSDRRSIFVAAISHAPQTTADLLRAVVTNAREAEATLELPGPTGESNTLRLRGRGVVVCLGVGPESTRRQIEKALAVGNAVVADDAIAAPLSAALTAAGAPVGLVTGVSARTLRSPRLVSDLRVSAVALDADRMARKSVADRLAARPGPITPLLNAESPVWRYGVERTLTINTTAAGGDVRLLSLPE